MTESSVTRKQVIAFRWRAHQLDRPAGSATSVTEVPLLDLGLQDTGVGGAAWALDVRGAPDHEGDTLALAWTVRGAPHLYRRADLPEVAVATAPLSEADAAKRIFDASKPLKAAGIPVIDALRTIARLQRSLVTEPMVKGELSGRLNELLDAPYLRECRQCQATHTFELPFRLAALQAGLELEPDTSPPVLRRIPGAEPNELDRLGDQATAQFDLVRAYLRFFAPARPRDVAGFLDAPLKDVRSHWPEDAVAVEVPELSATGRGEPAFALSGDLESLTADEPGRAGTVRLLGPFDPYLQLRDRATLVADPARAKDLWRALGRPGAVVVDGEIVGTWRPRASGHRLGLAIDHWDRHDAGLDTAVAEQAERFARFRGLAFNGIERTG
uniref:Winged helix DNA-binding domain-containing protein n=1 Tax=uncultured Nocardioidaceae bacterium TaxID=253824 RepID=A0A6J4MFC3_9ACTN|nr:MAG: FIG00816115: hypothetical protein [uncultured Nocardioidaceae bacterium]